MVTPQEKPNRLQELDAMRGIAAIMVVLFHYTLHKFDWFIMLFRGGTTGVDLFFVISGFVIFMSLQKVPSAKQFMINRVSRLYPTYWAAVTLTFLIITFFSLPTFSWNNNIASYLGNLTMFQFYLNIPDLDGPYWTMIIELLFYIWILCLYEMNLLKHIYPIAIITVLLTVGAVHFWPDNRKINDLLVNIPLLQFVPLFLAGIVFYNIYINTGSAPGNYCIAALCFALQISLYPVAGKSRFFLNIYQYSFMLMIIFSAFTLFVNHKLGFIVNRVTLFLGKISFALYLTHQYISIVYIIPFCLMHHVNFWISCFFVALPAVLVLATCITYFIEIPLTKRMKILLKRWLPVRVA